MEFFTKMLDGELDLSPDRPGSSPERAQAMIDGMAVRTKFFDDYLDGGHRDGVRQVVILASGLDARGLPAAVAGPAPWSTRSTSPRSSSSRLGRMADIGAQPTATRRTVAIDLREDWPEALQAADSTRPSRPRGWPRDC